MDLCGSGLCGPSVHTNLIQVALDTIEGGGYLRTSAAVISGKKVRKPVLRNWHRVDIAGDPSAAWRNDMCWMMVVCGEHGTAVYDNNTPPFGVTYLTYCSL